MRCASWRHPEKRSASKPARCFDQSLHDQRRDGVLYSHGVKIEPSGQVLDRGGILIRNCRQDLFLVKPQERRWVVNASDGAHWARKIGGADEAECKQANNALMNALLAHAKFRSEIDTAPGPIKQVQKPLRRAIGGDCVQSVPAMW